MAKLRVWLVLGVLLGLVCVLVYIYIQEFSKLGAGGGFINIQHNKRVVLRLNLDSLKHGEIDLKPHTGKNMRLLVDAQGVRVAYSDCEDGICIKSGYVGEYNPIACLPNGVVLFMGY